MPRGATGLSPGFETLGLSPKAHFGAIRIVPEAGLSIEVRSQETSARDWSTPSLHDQFVLLSLFCLSLYKASRWFLVPRVSTLGTTTQSDPPRRPKGRQIVHTNDAEVEFNCSTPQLRTLFRAPIAIGARFICLNGRKGVGAGIALF